MLRRNLDQQKNLVISIVEASGKPTDVEYVAERLGVAWGTARSLLLELTLERKLHAQKSTKSWLFTLNKNRSVGSVRHRDEW